MLKNLLIFTFLLIAPTVNSQKIDSIFFDLYTDSLKKGTHNYINVVGKFNNGRYLPLSSKEINFSTDYGTFDGNSLVLPQHPTVSKVTITATLAKDKNIQLSKTIYIKIKPDDELLKTNEEVLRNTPKPEAKKTKKKKKSNS